VSTLETDRLSGDTEWIDLSFVERERTPRQLSKVGIQLRLAGLSLSSTERHLEKLGVERSRTAIRNRVRKADLQPAIESTPNRVALDATVIRVDDRQRWLVAVTGSRWRPCVQSFGSRLDRPCVRLAGDERHLRDLAAGIAGGEQPRPLLVNRLDVVSPSRPAVLRPRPRAACLRRQDWNRPGTRWRQA
jgi:putative transposase